MDSIHSKIKEYIYSTYVEYVCRHFTTQEFDNMREVYSNYALWFRRDFVPELLLTYDMGGYDICNLFSPEQFFENNYDVFYNVLHDIYEYLKDYDREFIVSNVNVLNIMRTYVSIYVLSNITQLIQIYQSVVFPNPYNDFDEDENNIDNDLFDKNNIHTGVKVLEEEFNETNKEIICPICLIKTMTFENSLRYINCNHYSCIECHESIIKNSDKKLDKLKCPMCRCSSYRIESII
jgi:hypothetical protein